MRFNMATETESSRLFTSSGGSLDISVEQERDSYKEKLEHVQSLLRRYEQELQSYKVRKEGVETVSKLLHEARQEIVVLQRKCKKFESAIINLQNRLATHGLSDSITTEEGELIVPGLSKQYLGNLANENVRLRSLIRATSHDSEDLQRLKQNEARLLMEIDEIRRERDDAVEHYREMEAVLKSSGNDKDMQISLLGERMELVQKDFRAREVLCQSLTEESTKLKQQLKDVAVRCHQMAQKMESRESATKTGSKDFDVAKLTSENQSLREKISEIAEMNRRWQEYNSQREKYINQLKATIETQKKVIVECREANVQREQERERQNIDSDAEKNQLQEELHRTHQELVTLNEEKQILQNRIASGAAPTGIGGFQGDPASTIDALKAQVQLCTEDFASERRDREAAQSRIIQLQAEVEQLRRERDNLLVSRPVYNMANYVNDMGSDYREQRYMRVPSGYQPAESHLAPRGVNLDDVNVVDRRRDFIEYDAPIKEKTETADDKSDSFPSLQTIPSLTESDTSEKPSQILKCPKCFKEYTSDRHGELLEHMEVCCD